MEMRSPPSTPVQRWLPPPGIRSPTTLFPLPEAPPPMSPALKKSWASPAVTVPSLNAAWSTSSPVGSAGPVVKFVACAVLP